MITPELGLSQPILQQPRPMARPTGAGSAELCGEFLREVPPASTEPLRCALGR